MQRQPGSASDFLPPSTDRTRRPQAEVARIVQNPTARLFTILASDMATSSKRRIKNLLSLISQFNRNLLAHTLTFEREIFSLQALVLQLENVPLDDLGALVP
jgi:hypothetical protein